MFRWRPLGLLARLMQPFLPPETVLHARPKAWLSQAEAKSLAIALTPNLGGVAGNTSFWVMNLKRSESSRECTCVRTRPIEIAPDFRHRGTNTAFGSFSVLSGCHGCRSMPSITDTTKLCLLFDVSGTAIHLGKACRFSSRVA